MDLLIQLTTAGADAGPFDIYYDTVSVPTLLVSGITRSQLLTGYTVTSVPDTAIVILLKDTGPCNQTTSLNVPLTYTAWSPAGNTLSVPNFWPAISAINNSTIAMTEPTSNTLRAYSFDGSNYSLITSTSISNMGLAGLATLYRSNSPARVVTVGGTNKQIRTFDFDGSVFTEVGTPLNLSSQLNQPSVCALHQTRIAIVDEGTQNLIAYDYNTNTNTWSQKGNAYPSVGGFAAKVVALTTSRVVTFEGNGGNTRVYDFDGTNWTLISFQFINANLTAMCRLSSDTIAYIEDGSDVLKIYKYVTGNWIDQNVNYSLSGIFQPAITAMTPKRVAMIDNGSDLLRAFDLSTNVVASSPSVTPSVTATISVTPTRTPSVTTSPNASVSTTPTTTPSSTVTPSITPSQQTPIVTSGLIMNLDATNPSSYPGSGTSWTNLTGQSFSATMSNITFDGSDNGGAIVFDGTASGSINPLNFTNIPTSSAARTLQAWVKSTDTVQQYRWIFAYGDTIGGTSPSYNAYFMGASNNTAGFGGSVFAGAYSDSYFVGYNNVWLLMTLTYDGSTVKLYRNDSLVASSPQSFTTSNNQILIGNQLSPFGDTNSEKWIGKMRSILMYNRELSLSEIQQNYNYFSQIPSSPSATPSVTITPSVTSTPNASVSTTPSVTPTNTPSVTSSPNTSVSTTPTITPTISVTPTRTPSITITPSVTSSPSNFNKQLGTWSEFPNEDMNTVLASGYYMWQPNTYGTKPLPAFIYFGGQGEQGGTYSDLSTMRTASPSLPSFIYDRQGSSNAFPYEAIVFMVKTGQNIFPYADGYGNNATNINAINRLIDYLKTEYPTQIDFTRLYMTGYSLGSGYGVLWTSGFNTNFDGNVFTPSLDKITAMSFVAMSGGSYSTPGGSNLKNAGMPVLFIHGYDDTLNGQTSTSNVNGPAGTGWVASLNDSSYGNPPQSIVPTTQMIIGPEGTGHNIWDSVLDWQYPAGDTWKIDGKDIYQWLLGHVKLNTPSNFTATAVSSTQIDLSWSDVSNESGYKLEWSTNEKITNKQMTGGVATLTTSVTHGFSVNQFVRITGVDTNLNGLFKITQVTSNTFTYVRSTNPTEFADISSTAVSPEGTATPSGNDGWTSVGTINAGVTSYSHTGRLANKQYFYRLQARGNGVAVNNVMYTPSEFATANATTP
jgi:hypothetical protein